MISLLLGAASLVTTVAAPTAPSIGLLFLGGSGQKITNSIIKSNLIVAERGPWGEILSMTTDGVNDGKWIDIWKDTDGNILGIDYHNPLDN